MKRKKREKKNTKEKSKIFSRENLLTTLRLKSIQRDDLLSYE
jgi:hypothetical protein